MTMCETISRGRLTWEVGRLRAVLEDVTRGYEEACVGNIELRRLVNDAVCNAGHWSAERCHRWAHVGRVFGVEQATAVELCRQYDLDPDEWV